MGHTLPQSVQLDASQKRFLADDSAVKLAIWHRQKGKDFVAACDAVMDALETGASWYIISLTQRQADETFAKCVEWTRRIDRVVKGLRVESGEAYVEHDDELGLDFRHQANTLHFPGGGRVVSLPGRNPDTIAGYTGNIIFTELALFPRGGYDHWRVVFPLTTRGYRLVGITTPRGQDTKAYELFNDPEECSVHFCDIYQSVYEEGFVLHDKAGKPYPMATREQQEAAIESFRRRYNDEIGWQREYECQWTGSLETLLKMSQLAAAATRGEGRPFDCLRIDNDAGWNPAFFDGIERMQGRPELGWDVARHGHLSSLWINEATGDDRRLRYLVLMHNTSFELQRQVVRTVMDARAGAVGNGDRTGLGMDSNETLSTLYPGRWEGVDFGGVRKSELASALYTAYRDGTQTLPASARQGGEHHFIPHDLYAIQKEGNPEAAEQEHAKARLKLVETQNPLLDESHCDIAWSNALALRAGHTISPVTFFGSAFV